MNPSSSHLLFSRDSHFFVQNAGRLEALQSKCEVKNLTTDQLLHPVVPHQYVVRKGKLRISQFLDNGREVTRAVLQAGSVFSTRTAEGDGDKPAADLYILSSIVIMALGETELWAFAGTDLQDAIT